MALVLSQLCLQRIVDDFERYYLFYSSAIDPNILKLFEFLQRKYSFDILTHLENKNEMEEKYIDLLVNRYLKVLDTTWFKKSSWEALANKVKEIGSNIEKIYFNSLYFHETSEKKPWQDIICYLSNLKLLSFRNDCSDKSLENVAKFCHNIMEIDVDSSSSVSSEGLKYLVNKENGKAACSKLKKLCITNTSVQDEGVKYLLQNLPSLEIIVYQELPFVLYTMHKNNLSELNKIEPYNITTLDLLNDVYKPFFQHLMQICLNVCPRLKHLSCPILNKEELDFFSKLSDLEKLHLECNSDSEINISNLLKSKGGKLSSLTIQNLLVSVSVIAESCPRLKELCMNRMHFCCGGESKPVLLHSLESCSFNYSNDDSATAKAVSLVLSSSPNLVSISFKSCTLLSPEMKESILKCCENRQIRKICFSGSTVEIEFVKDILLNCCSLKSLNLDGCDFASDDEDELSRFAEILPNNPDICFSEPFSSDYDDLNDYYDFDDGLDDEYDDYDSDYYQYDYEDDYDDDEPNDFFDV